MVLLTLSLMLMWTAASDTTTDALHGFVHSRLFELMQRFGEPFEIHPFYGYLVALASYFVGVIIHEAGHVIAGLLVGFPFILVRIGALHLGREGGRWRLRWAGSGGAGGMAAHDIRGARRRRRAAIFTCGGLLANAIAAVLIVTFTNLRTTHSMVVWIYGWNVFMAAVSLLPIPTGGHINDGLRLLHLLRSKKHTKREMAITRIYSRSRDGERFTKMPRSLLRAAVSVNDRTCHSFVGHLLVYSYHFDQEQFSEAAIHLERCLSMADIVDHRQRNNVIMEAAIFQAWANDDAVSAKKWRERTTEWSVDGIYLLRWKIVEAALERKSDETLRHFNAALGEVNKIYKGPQLESSLQSWAEYKEKLLVRLVMPKRTDLAEGASG